MRRASAPVFRPRRRRGPLFYIVTTVLVLLFIAAAIVAGGGYWYMTRSVPQRAGTLQLAGLQGEVRVYRDDRGIPHIEAANVHDLFFAQGFITAQDRLWQMDLFRRIPAGRLAEILGEGELEQDKFFRTLGFREAAAKSMAIIDDEARIMGEAYAAGVNAYIDQVTAGEAMLPIEFRLLDYTPERWTLEDSVLVGRLMAYQLSGNWGAEADRHRVIQLLGSDVLDEWLPDYPDFAPAIVQGYNPLAPAARSAAETADANPVANGNPKAGEAEGLLEEMEPVDVESSPTGGSASGTPASGAVLPEGPDATSLSAELARLSVFAPPPGLGSNSWALMPSKTSTGGALLANDPHMSYGIPALWHQVQLVLEGDFSAVGIAVPGVPGVIFGRNEHIAWAITSLAADSQDLYIQRPNPDNPRQFLYKGEWETADVRTEVIYVKGRETPVTMEVLETKRHGPVLTTSRIGDGGDVISIAWTALGETREINALLGLMRARNFDEFERVLDKFDMPSLSFLYADVEGNIGYKAVGLLPRRPDVPLAGRVPLPAWDGEYDWLGTIPKDEMPRAYNPPQGFIVTANNLPADAAYPYYIGDEHYPWRALRIVELLEQRDDFTATDMGRIQLDALNTHARHMAPLLTAALETRLKGAANVTPAEENALALLQEWDFVEDPDDGAPFVWHMWRQELARLVIEQRLGFAVEDGLLLDHLLLAMRPAELEDVAFRSFREAVRSGTAKQGSDPTKWQWGRWHRMTAVHPVSAGLPGSGWLVNVGDWPIGGSEATVYNMGFDVETGAVEHGASWRVVVDFASRRGMDVLLPGNSGHILSPFYKDQADRWQEGGLFEQAAEPAQYRRGELLRLLPP